MKITYDKTVDMAYLELEKGKHDKSQELSGGVVVDVDKKGKILGFEIFDASKRIPDILRRKSKRLNISPISIAN